MDNTTSRLRNLYVKAYLGVSAQAAPKYWLVFQVSVPPLGWNTYFISKAGSEGGLCTFLFKNSYHSENVYP